MTPYDDEPTSDRAPLEPSDDLLCWMDDRMRTIWLDFASLRAEPERPEEGGSLLVDVVSVVDHMRRGSRPGFTVWIALEEALSWWTEELQILTHGAPELDVLGLDLEDPDPLRTALTRFVHILDHTDQVTAGEAFQQAVRGWVTTMSNHYNKGDAWPPPPEVPRWTQ